LARKITAFLRAVSEASDTVEVMASTSIFSGLALASCGRSSAPNALIAACSALICGVGGVAGVAISEGSAVTVAASSIAAS